MSELADGLGAAILAAGSDTGSGTGTGTDTDPGDALALVRRTAAAERVVGELLQQAVGAARAEGHSWAAIGAELDMSRQAAQQRFGARADEAADEGDGPEERWLGPVTAFDEMRELELAGRLGWHTVGAGMLRHRMARTDTQWEHRRVAWVRLPGSYEKDGWRIGARYFPWLYLVRDTGRPADT
jgi:hypothetical protein